MTENKILDIEIVTPQKVVYSGKAQSVTVPGSYSPFQILYNHAPIVSSLDLGLVKIVDESQNNHWFATSSGFTEVFKNNISILVETADDAENLDLKTLTDELRKTKEKLENNDNEEEAENFRQDILLIQNRINACEKFAD